MGWGLPQHGVAESTRSSLSCFSQRCLEDGHDLPEKFLLVSLLRSGMSWPQNQVERLQPGFHFAMCSVYRDWTMRPNHNSLLEGKGWDSEMPCTVWMSCKHSARPHLIGTGPSNMGIQPVLSHIKACNCVFLLTHNSADEQAQMWG